MRTLQAVDATPEQLALMTDYRAGHLVIRGAAGSGKTTTAVQRLKFVTRYWGEMLRGGHIQGPIRVRVLTYNRTLRGYVETLARDQVHGKGTEVRISTFAKWSVETLKVKDILASGEDFIGLRGRAQGYTTTFACDEADYVLGRFMPEHLHGYALAQRTGRGRAPVMNERDKQRFLDDVIYPYLEWKKADGRPDWNDLACEMALRKVDEPVDIVVIDEAQDFSANQARAVVNNLATEHSATWVLDAAQRIYPRYFQWKDVGLAIGPSNSKTLKQNHRNTKEIAAFAQPLLGSLEFPGDDASLPDFNSCTRDGEKPILLAGTFTAQMDHVMKSLERLRSTGDSVAIMHAKGGRWFSSVRERLTTAGLAYEEISGKSDWPADDVDIVLTTMHSAKGLEFDHVCIVGLNENTAPHGAEPGDSRQENYLRLLAMAIGRARKTVTIGYKKEEASRLIQFLEPTTYEAVEA